MFKSFTMERDMNAKHEKYSKESTAKLRHRIGYIDVGDIDVGDSDVGDLYLSYFASNFRYQHRLSLKHFDFEISLQCLLCCFLEAFTKFLCNSPIHQANFSRHRLEGIKLEY